MIEIVPSKPTHIGPLSHRLRDIDVLECGIVGHTPKQALRRGFLFGECYTVIIDGKVMGMLGVGATSMVSREATVWGLFAKGVEKHPRGFLVLGREVVRDFAARYGTLSNSVHASNVLAIRWLKKIGFEVKDAYPAHGHLIRDISICVNQLR